MPADDITYTRHENRRSVTTLSKIAAVRNGPEAAARRARFTAAIIDMDSPELAEIQAIVEKNLEDSINDPVLREKLRPNYRAACKRMIFSPDYYRAVQQPSVSLETGPIDRVEANGIRMKDGTFHELDVIVFATGFKVDQFVRPMKVYGRDGLDLDSFWAKGPRAYYAVTIPQFSQFLPAQWPHRPGRQFLTDRYCRTAVWLYRRAG